MLRNSLRRLCLLLIPPILFLFSCVFNSDEEYFRDLTQPDPATINGSVKVVDLKDTNAGDTVRVYGSTGFALTLTGQHGEIESVSVYMGTQYITSTTSNMFNIGLFHLKDGVHDLKVNILMRSGSGSLADAVGTEKLKVTLKWILKVDVSAPPQPIPTVDVIDGYLTFKWATYTRPNFKSYQIKRSFPGRSTETFEIKDRNNATWRDESYVGGYTSATVYSVAIVAETGTATSATISRTDPIDFTFSFNPTDSTFAYNWKPTKFYRTFKEYRIARGSTISSNVVTLSDINSSTYTNKLTAIRFGGDTYTWISVQSKTQGLPEYWAASTSRIGTPLPFEPVGEIKFNTFLNSLVALNINKDIVELNKQLEPVRTITTLRAKNWQMPYPGGYIYSTVATSTERNIYRLKLEDNSEVAYNYLYLTNQNAGYSVTSDGLICIDYDRLPVTSANIPPLYITKAFDPAGGPDVFAENSNTVSLSAVISEDGKFILANGNRVFRVSGGTTELVGSFTPAGSFMGFRQDNGSELMFKQDNKINFYDANTLTLVRTINPPAGGYYWYGSYDVQTKSMLWRSVGGSTRVYAVNIETGAAKSAQISTSLSPDRLYMLGDLLIYDGRYIQVKW